MKFIALKTEDGKITGKIAFYCRALDVTRQGFYDYLKNRDKPWKYEALAAEMMEIILEDECNDTYGKVSMHEALLIKAQENVKIPSKSTVYQVMNEIVLVHKPHRKPNGITKKRTRNHEGIRTSKTVDGETIYHIWDGGQIVNDVNEDLYSAENYIRGTGLVASQSFDAGVKSAETYYIQNAHGDVVNLADSTGAVTKTYRYDAFGIEKNIVETDSNPFRYCGEYYDKETGTVYLRARYYDPSNGRFISRDSFAGNVNDPLSLNLYTYCHNNPIVGIDPSGHFMEDFWDNWALGIDMLRDMGTAGNIFASYSEGVVDTLDSNAQVTANLISDPVTTIGDGISYFLSDPTRNNPLYGIRSFYEEIAYASYYHDWNSVAYSMGGATTNVAVVGATSIVGADVAAAIAPNNGVNVSFGG